MWFKVHYADGDILWQEWSRDLDNSAAYSNFIHREKPLYLLRFKAHIADRERVALNKRPITEVEPGDSVYVDLRAWNPIWYDQLELPNAYEILHVVLCQYTEWRGREKRKIILRCELFNENILYEHYMMSIALGPSSFSIRIICCLWTKRLHYVYLISYRRISENDYCSSFEVNPNQLQRYGRGGEKAVFQPWIDCIH